MSKLVNERLSITWLRRRYQGVVKNWDAREIGCCCGHDHDLQDKILFEVSVGVSQEHLLACAKYPSLEDPILVRWNIDHISHTYEFIAETGNLFSLDRELVLFVSDKPDKWLRDGISIIKIQRFLWRHQRNIRFCLICFVTRSANEGRKYRPILHLFYSGAKLIVRTLILYVLSGLREWIDVSLVEITALHNIKIGWPQMLTTPIYTKRIRLFHGVKLSPHLTSWELTRLHNTLRGLCAALLGGEYIYICTSGSERRRKVRTVVSMVSV